MKTLKIIRNCLDPKGEKCLPNEFGLLCWNVHKQNLGYRFDHFLKRVLEDYTIDLLALQEVKITSNTSSLLDSFHFVFAPNIRFINHMYGVFNGSRIPEYESFSLLSSHRESMIQTRKSAIFSTYTLHNGEMLLLVNLHAINFRATKVYHKELEMIFDSIRHHHGPIILTGDFNSWNKQRISFLMKLSGSLELQNSEIEHAHLIKSFMGYKLDHIFYRGLEVVESYAIDVKKLSDHNALYARFRAI
ncbi:endonuclease/exonuclease/phosphatase family protein [Sulfuricurvum sp.]|uniref:endonuclease/exonuclease/phosphatase family protein n=1 Tax=Sulfuricurvum sp. TaxID=2025608 RepID=UPI00260750FE|nr:endonuclease/exonuclease/phosphatase family protein [Sulfuricurvum sp.]